MLTRAQDWDQKEWGQEGQGVQEEGKRPLTARETMSMTTWFCWKLVLCCKNSPSKYYALLSPDILRANFHHNFLLRLWFRFHVRRTLLAHLASHVAEFSFNLSHEYLLGTAVHSEGDQPWDFFGRNDAKAETPVLWPPHVKSWLIGKRLWCWEGLGAGGEGDDRGWDGWMASPTRWMWVWVNGHDWATELNWTELKFLDNK